MPIDYFPTGDESEKAPEPHAFPHDYGISRDPQEPRGYRDFDAADSVAPNDMRVMRKAKQEGASMWPQDNCHPVGDFVDEEGRHWIRMGFQEPGVDANGNPVTLTKYKDVAAVLLRKWNNEALKEREELRAEAVQDLGDEAVMVASGENPLSPEADHAARAAASAEHDAKVREAHDPLDDATPAAGYDLGAEVPSPHTDHSQGVVEKSAAAAPTEPQEAAQGLHLDVSQLREQALAELQAPAQPGPEQGHKGKEAEKKWLESKIEEALDVLTRASGECKRVGERSQSILGQVGDLTNTLHQVGRAMRESEQSDIRPFIGKLDELVTKVGGVAHATGSYSHDSRVAGRKMRDATEGVGDLKRAFYQQEAYDEAEVGQYMALTNPAHMAFESMVRVSSRSGDVSSVLDGLARALNTQMQYLSRPGEVADLIQRTLGELKQTAQELGSFVRISAQDTEGVVRAVRNLGAN